jgi:hypothetical protein
MHDNYKHCEPYSTVLQQKYATASQVLAVPADTTATATATTVRLQLCASSSGYCYVHLLLSTRQTSAPSL